MNSSNSGTPSSKESIQAAAKRKAERQTSQRIRSKDRKPGGQKGHRGRGWSRLAVGIWITVSWPSASGVLGVW
jgi:hypothetical protein